MLIGYRDGSNAQNPNIGATDESYLAIEMILLNIPAVLVTQKPILHQ